MKELQNFEWPSTALFRVAGYGLLMLALFDYANVFIPSRFTNPVWEFQMMGELVEKSPVPLIGLVFVFYGKEDFRKDIEEYILRALSWACLAVGIAFLLLLPLGINNTLRLNTYNNIQINNQVAQRMAQLQQINNKLREASSEQDINNLFNNLTRQGRPPDIKSPEELKSRLFSEISTAQNRIKTESETTRKNQRLALLKNSAKWNLGSIIAGILFIYVWKITNWAR